VISFFQRQGCSRLGEQLVVRRQHQDAASAFSLVIFHSDGLLQLRK
jgi:hypothetical protein